MIGPKQTESPLRFTQMPLNFTNFLFSNLVTNFSLIIEFCRYHTNGYKTEFYKFEPTETVTSEMVKGFFWNG